MDSPVLQKYLFPTDKTTIFTSCDFHQRNETKYFNKDVTSSSIPITLREIQGRKMQPHLILFYFNKHREILTRWDSLGKSLPFGPPLNLTTLNSGPPVPLPPIVLKSVNLEYEKQLYETFKKITISNPFHWAKIMTDEKKYFILFYLNTFPVEFYNSQISPTEITDRYYKDSSDNYFYRYLEHNSILGNDYITNKKKEKFKAFDSLKLKGKYFKALEDNRPYPGVVKGRIYKIVEKTAGAFFLEELN